MNKNLFDFAEDKFLENIPTVITSVKKSLDQVNQSQYQFQNQTNEYSGSTMEQTQEKQLVKSRQLNSNQAVRPVINNEQPTYNNYPNYSNYQTTQGGYTNQNGLSTILTLSVTLLLIVLVFAVTFFIIKFT